MIFLKKKGTEAERGQRKVSVLRSGNPSQRPILIRIYGALGCLVITLCFIGFMIFLERVLPDGSKSSFKPSWNTDVPKRLGIRAAAALQTSCSSTQVDCKTLNSPERLRGRQQQIDCSTLTYGVECPTAMNGLVKARQTDGGQPIGDSCTTSIVECSNSVCFTEFQTLSPCPEISSTSLSPPIGTSGPVLSSEPSITPTQVIDPCVTSVVECSDSTCFTSFQTLSPCGGASSSPPVITSLLSTSPSPSTDLCVDTSINCISDECFTVLSTAASCLPPSSSPPITSPPVSQSPSSSPTLDPCIDTSVNCISDDCFTILSTAASCLPPSSSPPIITSPPVSLSPSQTTDPCIDTSVNCISNDCFTVLSTAQSCFPSPSITSPPISQTPSPSQSTDPCVATSVDCISEECVTVFSTQASCLPSTSSTTPPVTPTSSVDPCLAITTSCIETNCFAVTSTQASCLPVTSPPASVDPCLTSTVSCIETDCFTVTSTQASCLPSTSPSPTLSVDPCLTSTVTCDSSDVCVTMITTQQSCLPTSSPPIFTPTTSEDPCLTSTVTCDSSDVCFTMNATQSSCLISSPPTITPTSLPTITPSTTVFQCIDTETVFCNDIGECYPDEDTCYREEIVDSSCFKAGSIFCDRGKCFPKFLDCFEVDHGNICTETSFTQGSCSSTSSTFGISTSTVDPCVTSSVSCPNFLPRRKRQISTDCVTFYSTAASCITPTLTSSLPPCITSVVACPDPGTRFKRQDPTDCVTSFISIPGCGIISPTPTPTPTLSIDSCLTPEVTCTTVFPAVKLGALIAELGGFLDREFDTAGAAEPTVNCVTNFASITGCGVTITSNSSSSSTPPIRSISSTFPSKPTDSTSTNSTLSVLSTSSSIVLSPPDLLVTSLTSSSIPLSVSTTSSSLSDEVSPSPVVIVPGVTPNATTPVITTLPDLTSTSSSVSVAVSPTTPTSMSITPSNPISPTPSTSNFTPLTSPSSIIPSSQNPTTLSISTISASSSSSSSFTLSPPILVVVSSSSLTPSPSISNTSPPNPQATLTSSIPTITSTTPISLSSSSLQVTISSSFPAVSTTLLPPLLVLTSSVPSNTLLTESLPETSPTQESISATTINSPSVSQPSDTPSPSTLLPLTTPSASLSLGSIISSISATNKPVTTPSGTVSATRASLESEQASTSGTEPPGSRITPSASGTGGGGGGDGGNNGNSTNAGLNIFPINTVVVGNYIPIIVGRTFVQFITPYYQTVLLHEPIRQMTNLGGAPFSSLAGSPAIAIPITFAMLIANLGSGFATGATFLDTSYYCASPPCPPRLSYTPWVVNFIIAVLAIQAIAILFSLSQWWRKPNTLKADPTSIAGVAVVMGHPDIEREFSAVPAELTISELKRRMEGKRYKLGTFTTHSGVTKFGIMPVPPAEITAKQAKEKKEGFLTKLGALKEKIPFLNDWRNNRFYYDTIFAMLLLALLGLTCAALSHINNSGQIVFLATAASSGTGLRIFLAVLGTLVSVYWGRLFRDMQSFTPYIDLGRGDAEADPTILLRKHMFPITAFLPLLWAGHFTAASVAFTGLAAEFLIIALAGLPYRPGQQKGEFLFWSILSLFILTLMVAQLLIVNLWRRRLPTLTRVPDTIAATMTFVAGTGMGRDFEALSEMGTKERDEEVRRLGKSYVYGWRREEGGRARWVIDEVKGKGGERVPFDPQTSQRRVDSFEAVRI